MIEDSILRQRKLKNNNDELVRVIQQDTENPRVVQQPVKVELQSRTLFQYAASTVFTPEIVDAVDFIKKYFGWNHNTLLAAGMVTSNTILGATVPIKQSLFQNFLKEAQKTGAFSSYALPLAQFLAVLGGIIAIHEINCYCTKRLRDTLGYTIREEFGHHWYDNNTFYLIRHTESGKKLLSVGTHLVRVPQFFAVNLVDLANNRMSVLCHLFGSLISLYQASGWLTLSLLGFNFSIPYLIVVSVIYSLLYNAVTSSLVSLVKDNIQNEKDKLELMSKHVTDVQAKAESIAFLDGGSFEKNVFEDRNNEVKQINEAGLWPTTHLDGFKKLHRELAGVVVTLVQLMRGGFDVSSIMSITYSFSYVVSFMCWMRDNVSSLKWLESNLQDIKNFETIIDESKQLIQASRLTYVHRDDCVELDLTIPRKDGNGTFNIKKTLEPGKQYRIVGLNAAGKSTLLKIVRSKMMPQLANGTVILPGNVHFHPQEPYIINDRSYSLLEQLFYPRKVDGSKIEFVKQLMRELNFSDTEVIYYDLEKQNYCNWSEHLSGGQKQKVETIRDILNKGTFACFDEPTAALDVGSKSTFNKMIERYLGDIPILYIEHKDDVELPDVLKGSDASPIAIIEEPL